MNNLEQAEKVNKEPLRANIETRPFKEMTGLEESFFPKELLPEEIWELLGKENGVWLVTTPARWKGFGEDEERLREKYQDNGENGKGYGELAWLEIEEGFGGFFNLKKVGQMIEGLRVVHEAYQDLAEGLPVDEKAYYHNLGSWKEANGHVAQVVINTARELIGALKIKELTTEMLDLRKVEVVLKAMMIHDVDWDLVDSKVYVMARMRELSMGKVSSKEVMAVMLMVDYESDETSQDFKTRYSGNLANSGWGEKTVEIVREIVARADLLQAGDVNYDANRFSLATDFALSQPWFFNKKAGGLVNEVEASEPFYKFAKNIVFSGSKNAWRYWEAFYGEGDNLALRGWEQFEALVDSYKDRL